MKSLKLLVGQRLSVNDGLKLKNGQQGYFRRFRSPHMTLTASFRPRIALTMGDPAGIGSEILLKALAKSEKWQNCDVSIIGTRSLFKQAYERLKTEIDPRFLADPETLQIREIPLPSSQLSAIHWGIGSAASGDASFRYLDEAITRTLQGEFQAIVTAPIAKSAWKAAGHDYPGQTEILAERAGVDRFGMLFVGRSPFTGWTLRTLLATTHIPLAQVPLTLTPTLLSSKLRLLIDSLRSDFGLVTPTIAIAGLNPHSGEQGQLGREEIDWILPWLEEERRKYLQVKLMGLVPPDTLWVKPGQAWFGHGSPDGVADAYLALYHDQGLIPVKLMAFEQAINTTIGLPFIRTSPDHGTAFDIAGRGIAQSSSLEAALELAIALAYQRYHPSLAAIF
jgi:4-hydroxythreonine-4-phosphate dehydrogenase